MEEKGREKGMKKREVVLTDIMLGWSCKALAFQMPRLNFWFFTLSPHLPFFLSLRLEVATAAQLSALVMEGRGPKVMWSDRVLFENPVEIGHWDSKVWIFFLHCHCSDFSEWVRRKEGIKWRKYMKRNGKQEMECYICFLCCRVKNKTVQRT